MPVNANFISFSRGVEVVGPSERKEGGVHGMHELTGFSTIKIFKRYIYNLYYL